MLMLNKAKKKNLIFNSLKLDFQQFKSFFFTRQKDRNYDRSYAAKSQSACPHYSLSKKIFCGLKVSD